jgi:hypothetical protein
LEALYFNPDKVSLTGGVAEAVGCGVEPFSLVDFIN